MKDFFSIVSQKKSSPQKEGQNLISPRSLSCCSTKAARDLVPYALAKKLNVLPLGVMEVTGGRVMTVAGPIGEEIHIEQALRFAANVQTRVFPADKLLINKAIFIAYNSDGSALYDEAKALRELQPCTRSATVHELRPQTGEAAKFLASLIEHGIAKGASDLHIIPSHDGSFIKLRVNGELLKHDKPACSLTHHEQLISRIKVLAGLDTTQKTKPTDGSFSIPIENHKAHIRVGIIPTLYGEKAVLRFIGCDGVLPLDSLGVDPRSAFFLDSFLSGREGIALFVGPTGSGKSTTMYAALNSLVSRNLSIATIEDPVELHIAGVSQTSLNERIGLNYETALKSILRQDPDCILVGEIRDSESAKTTLNAALTGHLILSTVHARNVFEVCLRLKHLGIDPLTMSQAISVLFNQRLIPRLCDRCKVFDLQGSQEFKTNVFKAAGCKICDYSGYSGRILAVESLKVDAIIADALMEGVLTPNKLKELVSEENYVSIDTTVEKLLEEGKIGRDSPLRNSRNDAI